jgi:Family of unknown function (DUF6535)
VPETHTSAGVAHPNTVEGNQGDPSDKLFSVYLAQADKFDKEQSGNWKGYTEGILVFVCLWAILSLVPLTCFKYLRLVSSLLWWRRSSSRAISNFTRAQATQSFSSQQQLAALSGGTSISILSGLPAQDLQPSTSAIRVKILRFISLVLRLTCALLANTTVGGPISLILTTIVPPYNRARLPTFFTEGIE